MANYSRRECKHGCGLESRSGTIETHERTCLTPRTLGRLCEIGSTAVGDDDDACWIWTQPRTKKASTGGVRSGGGAYGRLRGDLVHRIAYEIATGEKVRLPHLVLHHCDVPACFNPKHLFKGTVADNNRDMTEKGRNWRQSPEARAASSERMKRTWEQWGQEMAVRSIRSRNENYESWLARTTEAARNRKK